MPSSGIQGYSMAIDRFPNTNPCETAGNPDPTACVGAEVTHNGAENRSAAVGDLGEGSHLAHAGRCGLGLGCPLVARLRTPRLRVDAPTR